VIAVAPNFVDHRTLPTSHTLFFIPSPDTCNFSNLTLHIAKVPPNLLTPLPLPTFLQASTTLSSQATHIPQPQAETAILDTIFTQWDLITPPTVTLTPKTFPQAHQSRQSSHYTQEYYT
jgi:hypothetical protein